MKNLLFCLLSYFCGTPFFASGQPIRTTLLPNPGNIRVINDSLKKNYTNITLDWRLLVNGLIRQKGRIPGLQLIPGRPRLLHLPLNPPAPGEEALIQLTWRGITPARQVLCTQTLPWKSWGGDLNIPVTGELSFADSNDVFTISSPTLNLSFDKETGWIRWYSTGQDTLIADSTGLRPRLSAQPHLQLFSTSTGSQMVIVRTEYTVPDLSCLLHLSYTINASGTLLVEQVLETDTSRQDSLPHHLTRFGMDWAAPPAADSLSWYGFTGEDNADTLPSIHSTSSATPAIATKVRWWSIRDHAGKGFRLSADSNLLGRIILAMSADKISIDDDLYSQPEFPIYYHYSFKVDPLPLNRFIGNTTKPAPHLRLRR
jgi:hypothetical protein